MTCEKNGGNTDTDPTKNPTGNPTGNPRQNPKRRGEPEKTAPLTPTGNPNKSPDGEPDARGGTRQEPARSRQRPPRITEPSDTILGFSPSPRFKLTAMYSTNKYSFYFRTIASSISDHMVIFGFYTTLTRVAKSICV